MVVEHRAFTLSFIYGLLWWPFDLQSLLRSSNALPFWDCEKNLEFLNFPAFHWIGKQTNKPYIYYSDAKFDIRLWKPLL